LIHMTNLGQLCRLTTRESKPNPRRWWPSSKPAPRRIRSHQRQPSVRASYISPLADSVGGGRGGDRCGEALGPNANAGTKRRRNLPLRARWACLRIGPLCRKSLCSFTSAGEKSFELGPAKSLCASQPRKALVVLGVVQAAERLPAEPSAVTVSWALVEFLVDGSARWRWGGSVMSARGGKDCPPVLPPVLRCSAPEAGCGSQWHAPGLLFTDATAADAANIVATMGCVLNGPSWVISLAHSYGFSGIGPAAAAHGIPLTLGIRRCLRWSAVRPGNTVRSCCLRFRALWRAWHTARAIPSNVALAISAGALAAGLDRWCSRRTESKSQFPGRFRMWGHCL